MTSQKNGSARAWFLAALAVVALVAFFALLPTPAADGEDAPTAAAPPSAAFVVTGARVFDGERSLGVVDVRVEDGRIAAVGRPGAPLETPPGVPRVDGAGHTLLPGLIDSHVHAMMDGHEQALRFGVTTVLDMFSDPTWAAEQRKKQRADGHPGAADVFSAGFLATVAGGHGTQFGLTVPTIDADTDLDAWVADRQAEGSDFVKIVVESGHTIGRELSTLGGDRIAGLARAAHARNLLAVAHVGSRAEAETALAAGVDGLVHLFLDQPPNDAVIAAAEGAFVVPTLTVLASVAGTGTGAAFADDPRIGPRLTTDQAALLRRSYDVSSAEELANAFATVRRLAAAGVPILAGSDAPNPGTAHGASLHHEMELLVEAGLTPSAALTAATAAPAAAFGLDDRGRIAVGRRADLVLVAGDPTADVTATRDLVTVWKAGVAAEALLPEPTGPSGAVPVVEAGLISDFGELTADLGTARGFGQWIPSTDERMGGSSKVDLAVVEGALRIRGEIRPGTAFPWAGAMWFAHGTPMEAADLSGISAVAFRARGVRGQGVVRVFAFAPELGMAPVTRTVEISGEWQRFAVPLADFGVTDGRLQALLVDGGGTEGPFEVWVDDVELVAR